LHAHTPACTAPEVTRTVPQEHANLRTAEVLGTSAFSAAQLKVARVQARSHRARVRCAPPEGACEPAHGWFSPHKLHLACTHRLARCKSKSWHVRMLMLACGRSISRARSTLACLWSELHRILWPMNTCASRFHRAGHDMYIAGGDFCAHEALWHLSGV